MLSYHSLQQAPRACRGARAPHSTATVAAAQGHTRRALRHPWRRQGAPGLRRVVPSALGEDEPVASEPEGEERLVRVSGRMQSQALCVRRAAASKKLKRM